MRSRQASDRIIVALALLLGCGALLTAAVSSADGEGEIQGTLTGNRRFLADAVAYLERVPGTHRAPARPITMDQRNHKFVPRILPVVKGATVRFLNSDHENHNVFSPDHGGYDLGNWAGGQHRERAFRAEGVFTQLCHLHPSMIGYVVVLQNPYFAVTARDGTFRIANVPPGRYRLKAWHERAEASADVVVARGQRVAVTLPMASRRR